MGIDLALLLQKIEHLRYPRGGFSVHDRCPRVWQRCHPRPPLAMIEEAGQTSSSSLTVLVGVQKSHRVKRRRDADDDVSPSLTKFVGDGNTSSWIVNLCIPRLKKLQMYREIECSCIAAQVPIKSWLFQWYYEDMRTFGPVSCRQPCEEVEDMLCVCMPRT